MVSALPLPCLFSNLARYVCPGGLCHRNSTAASEKAPFEVSIADLGARGAIAFASGFPGTLDQAAVRDEILPPGKAANIMDFIEHDQGQNFPHPGDGTQAVEGEGVVLLGCFHAKQLCFGMLAASRTHRSASFFRHFKVPHPPLRFTHPSLLR